MHSLDLQLLRGMNQIEIDTTSLLFKVYLNFKSGLNILNRESSLYLLSKGIMMDVLNII